MIDSSDLRLVFPHGTAYALGVLALAICDSPGDDLDARRGFVILRCPKPRRRVFAS
jgi:hypothetical protein